jgi:1-phosphofructokinase
LIKNTKNLFHNNQSLILVSNGKNGGILITPQNAYVCSIPKTKHKLVNAAGAGDSMLAGFIVSYLQGDNLELSLKKSIISGSATAFSERIATRSMVEQMLKDIKSMKVKQIKIN